MLMHRHTDSSKLLLRELFDFDGFSPVAPYAAVLGLPALLKASLLVTAGPLRGLATEVEAAPNGGLGHL